MWLVLGVGFGGLTAGQPTAFAEAFILPPPDVDLIGEIRVVRAQHHETLLEIAQRHGLGHDEILKANPGVDRWIPGEGTPVILPTRYILPDAPREGIVLNLPEMRLYYYPTPRPGERPIVITHPVSVGRMDWETPLGRMQVVAKQVDPPWYPPASIRAEHAARGDILPAVVPPGPDNPLGRYAMRLTRPSYLIHGTNRPEGVGMRVTHGCIRMYPDDIERLFPLVPIGTPVHIIKQPVKVGWLARTLFIEVHNPLEEDEVPANVTLAEAVQIVNARTNGWIEPVDAQTLQLIVEQSSGLPVAISDAPMMYSVAPRF